MGLSSLSLSIDASQSHLDTSVGLSPHCIFNHLYVQLQTTVGAQPSKEPAGLLSSAQPARQTDIRFWAVRADCSPSAIVARVKWMGSEPEMVLNKPPLVSNKRTDCIQNRTVFTGGWSVTVNKHSVSHTYTEMTLDTRTVHPLPPPSSHTKVASSTAGLLPCWSGQQ